MSYKVIATFPDGEVIDSEEMDGVLGVFDDKEDANDWIDRFLTDYETGGEVLHLSNPGDYPMEVVGQEPDFEIVKV